MSTLKAEPLDLLHADAGVRLDAAALRQALTFAFATGGGGDAFDRVLVRVVPASSTYTAECYENDLFLDDFAHRCVATRMKGARRPFQLGALKALLGAPPEDRRDVELRRGVFRELLERPDLAVACEQAWKQVDALRTAFEAAELGKRSGAIARRVEILRQLRDLVRWLPRAFAGAQSALHRLARFSAEAQCTEGFLHLEQLLDYEDNRATLDLRVKIGRDGQIRSLDIVRLSENTENPGYQGPWTRLWRRVAALLRGYQVQEREVIGRLVESVFEGVQPLASSLIQGQLQIEFYLAFEGLRRKAEALNLSVALPDLAEDAATPSEFEQLFNPFLLLEESPPVPCDLKLAPSGLTLLTGPNSGGKTRLMQALALSQLLAQSGTYVPARRARLGWRRGMFVSLVHEMSADQREGRLGTELIRIRRLFERIGFDHVVLLDELCSGTNPSEGEEIVELVIALLSQLRPQALICTHFLQFAGRLKAAPPIGDLAFLQVELDPSQKPLYQFVEGVASTSLAARTAERLGVTRESLEALIAQKREARSGPTGQ